MLYNEIYGAPIFDVYHDDEEPIFDVSGDADDNLVILSFEYFPKDIQVNDSRITINIHTFDGGMDDSSFAPSPKKNESFKDFIDVSQVEALITRLWIRSVTRANSAPTRPIQKHEPTLSPKKLDKEEIVPVKPPPLRDKKFAQLIACSASLGVKSCSSLNFLPDVSFMTVVDINFSMKHSSNLSRVNPQSTCRLGHVIHPAFFHVNHTIVNVSINLRRSCSSVELVVSLTET